MEVWPSWMGQPTTDRKDGGSNPSISTRPPDGSIGSPAVRRRPGKRGSLFNSTAVRSNGLVAQFGRALGCHPRGRGFKSRRDRWLRRQIPVEFVAHKATIHRAESEAKRVHEPTFSGRRVEGGPCPAIHQGVQGPVAQFAKERSPEKREVARSNRAGATGRTVSYQRSPTVAGGTYMRR